MAGPIQDLLSFMRANEMLQRIGNRDEDDYYQYPSRGLPQDSIQFPRPHTPPPTTPRNSFGGMLPPHLAAVDESPSRSDAAYAKLFNDYIICSPERVTRRSSLDQGYHGSPSNSRIKRRASVDISKDDERVQQKRPCLARDNTDDVEVEITVPTYEEDAPVPATTPATFPSSAPSPASTVVSPGATHPPGTPEAQNTCDPESCLTSAPDASVDEVTAQDAVGSTEEEAPNAPSSAANVGAAIMPSSAASTTAPAPSTSIQASVQATVDPSTTAATRVPLPHSPAIVAPTAISASVPPAVAAPIAAAPPAAQTAPQFQPNASPSTTVTAPAAVPTTTINAAAAAAAALLLAAAPSETINVLWQRLPITNDFSLDYRIGRRIDQNLIDGYLRCFSGTSSKILWGFTLTTAGGSEDVSFNQPPGEAPYPSAQVLTKYEYRKKVIESHPYLAIRAIEQGKFDLVFHAQGTPPTNTWVCPHCGLQIQKGQPNKLAKHFKVCAALRFIEQQVVFANP